MYSIFTTRRAAPPGSVRLGPGIMSPRLSTGRISASAATARTTPMMWMTLCWSCPSLRRSSLRRPSVRLLVALCSPQNTDSDGETQKQDFSCPLRTLVLSCYISMFLALLGFLLSVLQYFLSPPPLLSFSRFPPYFKLCIYMSLFF